MRIAVLSNVNLDLLCQILAKKHEIYQQEGYGQWVQETIAPSDSLSKFKPEAVFILLDGSALLDGVVGTSDSERELGLAIQRCENMARQFPSAPIFISNIDIAPKEILPGDQIRSDHILMHFWERKLELSIAENTNIHLFDLRALIEEYGRRNFYSDKMWYMGSIPYNIKAFSVLADAIDRRIHCYKAIRKKVLVLDLDNTLWGGVLGEDGFDGIQISRSLLGASYRDAQLRIKELASTGVLLAIVSKNDEEDVLRVLREHSQMVLRVEDFVAIYANWDDKTKNIVKLAELLNLGLDSFVFLDDNHVEREMVRTSLPEVTVVDFPKDVANLPNTIKQLGVDYFYTDRLTKEDLLKTAQYHQEVNRKKALVNVASLEEYLISLEMNIILEEMQESQLERVSQLTQKTNQFNLNTARYTPEELKTYCFNKGNHIYTATVSDRYGDSGLVFVLMISTREDKAQINNLLMSCRVMGRHIEDTVIDAIEEKMKRYGIKQIEAKYIPTAKNKPVEDLMERLGYRLVQRDNNGIKCYCRFIDDECPERKVLFRVNWRS